LVPCVYPGGDLVYLVKVVGLLVSPVVLIQCKGFGIPCEGGWPLGISPLIIMVGYISCSSTLYDVVIVGIGYSTYLHVCVGLTKLYAYPTLSLSVAGISSDSGR